MKNENKHTPTLKRSSSVGFTVTDGLSKGSGNTIEAAYDAFNEDKAFRPTISQDNAYYLLRALEGLLEATSIFHDSAHEQLVAKAAIAKARGLS